MFGAMTCHLQSLPLHAKLQQSHDGQRVIIALVHHENVQFDVFQVSQPSLIQLHTLPIIRLCSVSKQLTILS